ncbi:MAG: cysteine peptidase family C39 domain-containing protein, partial [Woeseia sp.]
MVSGTFSPRFRRPRRGPVILQTEAAECGLACLAMVASAHGFRTDLAGLRRRRAISQKGATLADLMQFAQSLDLAPRAVRLEPEEMNCLNLPCILHWNMDHYVVLEQVRSNTAVIVDPAVGRTTLPLPQLRRLFTGVALELVPTARFTQGEDRARLRLRDITANTRGLAHTLAIVFIVSVSLQVIALVLPFYSQLVIDDVVISSDRDLLNLLALSFALLVGINSLVSMLRSWIVVTLSTRLNLQWTVRVFHHLTRLPLDYFEKRHLGDVQSRFGSVTALQRLITTQFVEAVLDGLMALTTLVVMVLYSIKLAVTVATSVIIYFLVRLSLYPLLHAATQEVLVNGARKDSFFLESVRGI